MCNIKNIVLIGFAILISQFGISQTADPSINILMQPASVSLYTTGNLEVTLCNEGFTPIVANSLRATITVQLNAEIMGINLGTSDPQWTQTSLTTGNANTIMLVNTIGTMESGECVDVNLTVKGKVLGFGEIASNLVYINANNPLLGGAPNSSQGNTVGNDNSETSLTVTAFLPIKLESFQGNLVNCKTELDWKTSAEDNLKNYEVEYSVDGKTFVTVGVVTGKGKNGDGSSYSFTHTPRNGVAYYRLKSVDNNTSFSYSEVINVTKSCDKRTVSIYPNPSSDNMVVSIDNPVYDAGVNETGILYNSEGREVQKLSFQNGTNNVDVSMLSSGIYVLKIITKDGNENYQVIIE